MAQYVVANWKMNGDIDLINDYKSLKILTNKCKLIICPPDVFVGFFDTKSKQYSLGLQNISDTEKENGAFTGEISAHIAKESGCKYTLIGHSERRIYQSETDKIIYKKFQNASNAGLNPIICIGESLEDYKSGNTLLSLSKQLKYIINNKNTLDSIIIAYEPLWSIGTGLVPEESDIEQISNYIRNLCKNHVTGEVILLYGGSVNKDNSDMILNTWPVDGVLVGGASTSIEHFEQIINSIK